MKKITVAAVAAMLALISVASAQVSISGLPSATTPLGGTEVAPIVQGTTTKKVAVPAFVQQATIPFLGLSFNGLTISTSTGTLAIANGKTLTDTSAIGANVLLGATGGGFSVYGGAACTNQFIRSLSTAAAATCNTVQNSDLANSTISGIALGSNLSTLTFGTHLISGGSSYNGSAGVTITSDATNANTASTIVARDSSGNFSAGTITAGLTGHSSLDLPLAGGTFTGGIGFSVTNTLDIGTSATVLAPRTVYAGTSFVGPVATLTTSATIGAGSAITSSGPGGALGSNAFNSTAYLPLAGGTLTGNLLFTDNTYDIGATGATRPRTGYFGTSIVAPLLIGGSAASSTLTLESTSGVGTTDAIIFNTGSQVFAGKVNTGGQWVLGPNIVPISGVKLTVTGNTVAPSSFSASAANVVMQMASADSTNGFFLLDSFGTSVQPLGILRRARGTQASPTAVLSGDSLGFFGMLGAISAGTFAKIDGTQGGVFFGASATENWSVTNMGSNLKLYTTPNTTAAIALAMTVNSSGGLGIGTATDPGIGSLQINANIYAPNLPTTTAALGAAVCWTTTTGQFQRDTNAGGCLVSAREAKTIRGPLLPKAAFDIVAKLKPEVFHYKEGFGDGGKFEQIGFVADEVANADERFAIRNEEGHLSGVRYMQITAALAGAIQHLKADNDNLRHEVEQIKRRVSR